MTCVSTICARGGSKGVPKKNIREIAGKPLLVYTIEFAIAAGCFDAIIVTSDDDQVLEIATRFESVYAIKRPLELATDTAPKLPAIRHALAHSDQLGIVADIVVDFDPTSPLRSQEDLRGVLDLLATADCSNVITGCVSRRNPYFNMVEVNGDGLVTISKKPPSPISSRQEAPVCYDMNASIYAWKRGCLDSQDGLFGPATRFYEMPPERSLDIDTALDLEIVSQLLAKDQARLRQAH